jgi:hypothetical protein
VAHVVSRKAGDKFFPELLVFFQNEESNLKRPRAGWLGGKDIDLYLAGSLFESPMQPQISGVRLFVIFLKPAKEIPG